MLGNNVLHAVSLDKLASSVASASGDYFTDWVKVGAVAHGDGLGVEEVGYLLDVTAVGTSVVCTIQEAPDSSGTAGTPTDTSVTLTITAVGAVAISDYRPTQPWSRLKVSRTGAATLGAVFSLVRPRELPATHGADVTVAVGAHGELT